MRTKTRSLAICLCSMIALSQFFSCKKENTAPKTVNAGHSDLAVETIGKANLMAWYKFTDGNKADYSVNNNRLKAHNVTLANDYMERPYNAYFFNGHNSFMSANNSNSLNPSKITMAALVKPMGYYQGAGGQSRILMKGVDDQSYGIYFLGFDQSGKFFAVYGDGQFQSNTVNDTATSRQLNTWYKVVYTYDGSVGKLYVNDTLVSQSNQIATFNPNDSPLNIGKTGRIDYPYWFNGVIDEIRIYNIGLARGQVSKLTNELGQ